MPAGPRAVVLALETATPVCAAAVVDGQGILAASALQVGLRHSVVLFAQIQQLLAAARLSLAEVTHVAVSIGPGSFTGLRIGLSAAKGLCLPDRKPLLAVPTLAALAARVPAARAPVCAVVDARKGELYAALYDTASGWPVELVPARAVAAAQLARERAGQPTVFAGPGVDACPASVWNQDPALLAAPPDCRRADAAAVGQLALHGLAAGSLPPLVGEQMERLEPLYLRGADVSPAPRAPAGA